MSTISIRFTNQSDIERWQKILDKGGTLGPRQQARWDEWHRHNGSPPANVLGRALVQAAHERAVERRAQKLADEFNLMKQIEAGNICYKQSGDAYCRRVSGEPNDYLIPLNGLDDLLIREAVKAGHLELKPFPPLAPTVVLTEAGEEALALHRKAEK